MNISVLTKDKIDFVLANRELSPELVTLLEDYSKLEDILDNILDNIILNKTDEADYSKILKLLREMESMSNGIDTRKIKRNSNAKSKTIFKTLTLQLKRRRKRSC